MLNTTLLKRNVHFCDKTTLSKYTLSLTELKSLCAFMSSIFCHGSFDLNRITALIVILRLHYTMCDLKKYGKLETMRLFLHFNPQPSKVLI